MFKINKNIEIPENELIFTAIRSQGAGGQNVNKVASAMQLRFDINTSSLPDYVKQKLLRSRDHRITADGIIIIKAQEFRSQSRNRDAALVRLQELISRVCIIRKKRIETKTPMQIKRKRMDNKNRRGRLKKLRKITDDYE
jgi:ribosome-associated protein